MLKVRKMENTQKNDLQNVDKSAQNGLVTITRNYRAIKFYLCVHTTTGQPTRTPPIKIKTEAGKSKRKNAKSRPAQ